MVSVKQVFAFITLLSACVDAGELWFVSHRGNDFAGCRSIGSPCKSLAYTVPLTGSKATIFLQGDGQPYVHQQDDYIIVNKTLTIAALNDTKPEIGCTSVLFLVGSEEHKVTLNLHNLTIHNCRSTKGAIVVHNGRLSISSCRMMANGVLIHHPQSTMPGCNLTEIFMHNSEMNGNQVAKPFHAGILLLGCESLIFSIQNTSMVSSSVRLQAETSIQSTIVNVTFDGTNVRTSSFDATLAKKSNVLSFTRVNVTNHSFSRDSPINIAINEQTIDTPHINFKQSRFFNNRDIRTDGAGLSVQAHFQHSEPLLINALISRCLFHNNSAQRNGGAINILNTKGVTVTQSNFTDNQASNGAAIYANKASNILVLDSKFLSNIASQASKEAMSSGGAIYSTHSDIVLSNSSFVNNTAGTSGSAISMDDVQSLQITNCLFEVTSHDAKVGLINAQSLNSSEYQTSAWVSMAGSTVRVTARSTSPNILNVNAPLSLNANAINCSNANPVRMVYRKPEAGNYDYKQTHSWCETCPEGEHPDQNGTCRPCPEHSDCRYGQIIAHKNYWVDETCDAAKLCPKSLCNATDISPCVSDRTGPLCMQCMDGFSPSVVDSKCVPNEDCLQMWKVYTLILGCGCLYLIFILLLVCCMKNYTDDDDTEDLLTNYEDEETEQENGYTSLPIRAPVEPPLSQASQSASIVAVLFLHYQSLLYIGQQYTFHKATQWLADIINMQVLLVAFPKICNVFEAPFVSLLYTAGTPIVALSIWIIATIFRSYSRSPRIHRVHHRVTGVLLVAILICNAPMLSRSFEMLHCVPVGNSSVLYTQHGLYYCNHSWQYVITAFVFLCLIPLVVSIEVAVRQPPGKVATGLMASCPLIHLFYELIRVTLGMDTDRPKGVVHHLYMNPFKRDNHQSWFSIKSWLAVILMRVNVAVILSSLLSHRPMMLSLLLAGLVVVCLFIHLCVNLHSLDEVLYTLETANLFLSLAVAIGNIALAVVYEFNKHGLSETLHVFYQIAFFTIILSTGYIVMKNLRANRI
ncbi:hypothetical protein CAPTEDRAFT_214819 [Capitella teleta]|uniref:Right handed beta helix domain-containing protein n=1 Tax=Capitella teleta TaxID=283909 RepID=R7V1R2_CAPTE|nr:hypothetical protein CAPTEDRAFT_214819 [Capitella teleta]|eukprot:ELU12494.1 hypothetical protein CAPTEDRAFT_214819 [Capitella teleta]